MKNCIFCATPFVPQHGNQQYCTPACKKNQKASIQRKLYGILKEFRKGYLLNYKIFEALLSKSGSITFPSSQLFNDGFKPNCFYGSFINEKQERFYKVGGYHFRIFGDGQKQLITILKS